MIQSLKDRFSNYEEQKIIIYCSKLADLKMYLLKSNE